MNKRTVAITSSGIALMAVLAGCETSGGSSAAPEATAAAAVPAQPASQNLREGDVLEVKFPGAPTLDTPHATVRPDGKITLPIIGEVLVTGLTPTELETQLKKLYASQVLSTENKVTVISSSFDVTVVGAIMKPGPLRSNHKLTVLDAVMESGGFDNAKADTKKVKVMRKDGNQMKNFILNLQPLLDGKPTELFYLEPGDIVLVPEKFKWF